MPAKARCWSTPTGRKTVGYCLETMCSSGKKQLLTLNQACSLCPVTDDMAMCHPSSAR